MTPERRAELREEIAADVDLMAQKLWGANANVEKFNAVMGRVDELLDALDAAECENRDLRDCVRLIIGRHSNKPWRAVPESDVDGYLRFIREQRETVRDMP